MLDYKEWAIICWIVAAITFIIGLIGLVGTEGSNDVGVVWAWRMAVLAVLIHIYGLLARRHS